MMQFQADSKPTKKDPYIIQKVTSASPEQLIAYIYDAGATSCAKGDRFGALKAVNSLVKALNFDYKETAITFYNVYRRLRNLITIGRLEEAKDIFVDLKQTWSKAFKVV